MPLSNVCTQGNYVALCKPAVICLSQPRPILRITMPTPTLFYSSLETLQICSYYGPGLCVLTSFILLCYPTRYITWRGPSAYFVRPLEISTCPSLPTLSRHFSTIDLVSLCDLLADTLYEYCFNGTEHCKCTWLMAPTALYRHIASPFQ